AVVQARSGDADDRTGAGAADIHRAFEGADLADAPGGGVLVRSIESGSPASQTQLRANDVITNVNRQRVNNLKELRAAAKNQTTLLVTVRRGTATALIPIR